MKFYFDSNIDREELPKEQMILFYSSYTHGALKVDALAASIFEYIIAKGPGQDIKNEEIANAIPELEPSDVQEILEDLYDSHLFYPTISAFHADCFEARFQAELSFDPKQIYLHLTYHCNLACEYCYQKEKLNRNDEMSLGQWKQVIDDLKAISTPRIHLTGGEPTLYKDFDAIVDYIHAMGMEIELLTNGTTLHKIKKETLKKLYAVTISLDSIGNAKTHRVNSEKYNVLNNILMVNDMGLKTNVRSVISTDTVREVYEVKEYLAPYGIRHIIAIYIPNTPDEICNVPTNINSTGFNRNANLQDISRCSACFQVLSIDPAGLVFPCQSLMHDEFIIGNVKEHGWLSSIKNHNLTKYFLYRNVGRIDGCRDCEVKSICGGGCPAISYNLYHNLEHKLDYACEHLKNQSKFQLTHIEFE